jgi:hypothetical protein
MSLLVFASLSLMTQFSFLAHLSKQTTFTNFLIFTLINFVFDCNIEDPLSFEEEFDDIRGEYMEGVAL